MKLSLPEIPLLPAPFQSLNFPIPPPRSLPCLFFCLLPLSSVFCLNLVLQSLSEISVFPCLFVFFLQSQPFPWPLCHLKTFSIPWIPPVPWADLRSALFTINWVLIPLKLLEAWCSASLSSCLKNLALRQEIFLFCVAGFFLKQKEIL